MLSTWQDVRIARAGANHSAKGERLVQRARYRDYSWIGYKPEECRQHHLIRRVLIAARDELLQPSAGRPVHGHLQPVRIQEDIDIEEEHGLSGVTRCSGKLLALSV